MLLCLVHVRHRCALNKHPNGREERSVECTIADAVAVDCTALVRAEATDIVQDDARCSFKY
ncbi:hypothetical protein GCM10007421_09980 [Halopseudomonas oceani]|nr:hypothetical protein GCM10007421_09980 [Halopseudomonas oceani]